jgi:Aromatic acid exporter family member 1
MKLWAWDEKNLPSIAHAIRTAVAATVSVIIARLVGMPEAYWAAIATLVVMQSTLGAKLTLSMQRIVATAVGASVAAIESTYFGANWLRSRRVFRHFIPSARRRVRCRPGKNQKRELVTGDRSSRLSNAN